MRVFVAGATGAIGRRLVPLLVARGFEVVGMTRSQRNRRALLEAGAEPVVADGLDRASVIQAVMRTEPEVVVHEMTDLAGATNLRRFDGEFATTNRLRTEGTDHLVEAARRARARRVVAQSFGNWNYERTGGRVKRESDPLDPDPPASMRQSLAAIRHLESVVAGESGRAADEVEGVVLCYGNLYGAGTGWSDPALVELVRAQAAEAGSGARGEAAQARAGVARPACRRRGCRVDVHPDPRCLEREGQARVWLAPPLPELARGLRARPRVIVRPAGRAARAPSASASAP